ncbi:MAG: hypothetical protein HW389_1783, partial [Bacteroidetes bacterium]|nr:hypothetical protein [Bacteroidota bacterium]
PLRIRTQLNMAKCRHLGVDFTFHYLLHYERDIAQLSEVDLAVYCRYLDSPPNSREASSNAM